MMETLEEVIEAIKNNLTDSTELLQALSLVEGMRESREAVSLLPIRILEDICLAFHPTYLLQGLNIRFPRRNDTQEAPSIARIIVKLINHFEVELKRDYPFGNSILTFVDKVLRYSSEVAPLMEKELISLCNSLKSISYTKVSLPSSCLLNFEDKAFCRRIVDFETLTPDLIKEFKFSKGEILKHAKDLYKPFLHCLTPQEFVEYHEMGNYEPGHLQQYITRRPFPEGELVNDETGRYFAKILVEEDVIAVDLFQRCKEGFNLELYEEYCRLYHLDYYGEDEVYSYCKESAYWCLNVEKEKLIKVLEKDLTLENPCEVPIFAVPRLTNVELLRYRSLLSCEAYVKALKEEKELIHYLTEVFAPTYVLEVLEYSSLKLQREFLSEYGLYFNNKKVFDAVPKCLGYFRRIEVIDIVPKFTLEELKGVEEYRKLCDLSYPNAQRVVFETLTMGEKPQANLLCASCLSYEQSRGVLFIKVLHRPKAKCDCCGEEKEIETNGEVPKVEFPKAG